MQKFTSTNMFITILILIYMIIKISMYIKYKKSGKIMLKVKLKKDLFAKLIWVIIGVVLVVPEIRLYLSGNVVLLEAIRKTILWVFFITVVAVIETQTPKITEGGIASNGKFWNWKDVSSCRWEKVEGDVLSVDTINKLIFFKYPSVLRWRILPEQKLILSKLMKNKMK